MTPLAAGDNKNSYGKTGSFLGGRLIKRKQRVVIITAAAGLVIWSIYAATNSGNSPAGIFSGLVISGVPATQPFFRLFFLTGVVMSGMVVTRLIWRQAQMKSLIMQAKKDWEETFDIINDAITIHDKDFNIIRANKAATELLGAPFRDILSRKCYLSYHGTDYPPESCPSCRTLMSGVPSVTETFEANLNKHLEIKALPRLDRNRRVVGVVHVVRDISDRVTTEEQLRSLSLTDDLTGLYNRRGFMTLAEQEQKMAVRMKKGFNILFADLDGLKEINDALGHAQGCQAIIDTSSILRDCFRESDIISRIGGDEFVVFSIENSGEYGSGVITGRLQKKIDDFNARGSCRYKISLSTGIVHCGPDCQRSISDMLHEADQLMYKHKRSRKNLL